MEKIMSNLNGIGDVSATKGSDVVKTEVLVLKWTEVGSLVDPEFE